MLHAEQLKDVYSATVSVSDYSEGARAQAVRLGLLEVLVRMTGLSSVANRPEARDMLANVNAYVVEYSYTALEGKDGDTGLKVQYDRAGIDRYLRARELPIWPLNRPRIVVWLVSDSLQGNAAFVTDLQAAALQSTLNKQFVRRGMPVVYPLYDLQDQQVLPAEKALGFATEAVGEASARYPVEGWMVVRLHQPEDEQWRGAWVLGRGDQSMQREVAANSLEKLLETVVDQAVDAVASNFTYVARKTADRIELDVQGVSSFRAYNRLIDLLEDMAIIRTVEVTGLDGDRIQLTVGIEGERAHLMDSLYRYSGIEPLDNSRSAHRDRLFPEDMLPPENGGIGIDAENQGDVVPDEPADGSVPDAAAIPQRAGVVERLRWVGGR